MTGITRPVTKHNVLVKDVKDLARVIHEAFHIARTGRPGPVLVDLPVDVQSARAPRRLTLEIEPARLQAAGPRAHPPDRTGGRGDQRRPAARAVRRRRA